MFTGIVEELGTIQHIARGQHSAVLTIQAKTVLEHTKLGDSIAVNGICLTVTQLHADRFSADVMHETLNRSALAQFVRRQSGEPGTRHGGGRPLWRAHRGRTCGRRGTDFPHPSG